jgi:hypothetical protein
MEIHGSIFPETVTALTGVDADRKWPARVKIDETVNMHLTLEQTRSLWHELGFVLQSEDHEFRSGAHEGGQAVSL